MLIGFIHPLRAVSGRFLEHVCDVLGSGFHLKWNIWNRPSGFIRNAAEMDAYAHCKAFTSQIQSVRRKLFICTNREWSSPNVIMRCSPESSFKRVSTTMSSLIACSLKAFAVKATVLQARKHSSRSSWIESFQLLWFCMSLLRYKIQCASYFE